SAGSQTARGRRGCGISVVRSLRERTTLELSGYLHRMAGGYFSGSADKNTASHRSSSPQAGRPGPCPAKGWDGCELTGSIAADRRPVPAGFGGARSEAIGAATDAGAARAAARSAGSDTASHTPADADEAPAESAAARAAAGPKVTRILASRTSGWLAKKASPSRLSPHVV